MMKKAAVLFMVVCLLLTGCGKTQSESEKEAVPAVSQEENSVPEEQTMQEPTDEAEGPALTGKVIEPLPDTTMENLTDAILPVSFEKGNAYVDEEGILQLDVAIYSYDKYDMVDIAMLEVGDVIVGYAGEVEVTSVERNEAGMVMINGGLGEGGFDLVTEDNGIFFEVGFDDAKNWYEVGTATLRVSVDMIGTDHADPDLGEVTFYPGDLLNDSIENFTFTPHNTTVRVEEGQIVEINRRYTP